MIISASRRTDIPAFYAEWFINRVKEGFLFTRNPFNKNQIRRISLRKVDVDAIVFWTRNPDPLMHHLPLLDTIDYHYYFQYTITGYTRLLEKSVPTPYRAIESFKRLSDYVGPGRVIWRYDPIILSNITDTSEHKRLYEKIARELQGKTERSVISFVDFYKKTKNNLKSADGVEFTDITASEEKIEDLSKFIGELGRELGMSVTTCSETADLKRHHIFPGKCIDDQLIEKQFGFNLNLKKDLGQREECGCVKSVDIGTYNTCIHGCIYCYATYNKQIALKNFSDHDVNSPFLIGGDETNNNTDDNEQLTLL